MKKEILENLNIELFYSAELPSLKPNGNGQAMALCPFHDDHRRSFSVNLNTGLYYCHGCGERGDIFTFYQKRHGCSFKDALAELARQAGIEQKRIVAVYDYTDAEGNLLFQTVRYEPKDFKQRRPDGRGGWIYNLSGVKLVPYNLPEVMESSYCILVEGEKDVETLKSFGFIASCNPMGAGKWRSDFNEYFRAKRVYIIPDNDKPGRDHALQVAKNLKGIAEAVKIVELSGLKDISDWFHARLAEGKNHEEIKLELKALLKNAPEWTSEENKEPDLLSSLLKWNDILNLNVKVEYLLDKLIPKGSITMLFGRGGIGKTSLCLQIGRSVAEGIPFAGLQTIKTPVYYIDFENPLSVLKQRVEGLGKAEGLYIWHLSGNPQPPRLDTKEWELYKQLPAGLLIFDTLRASHLADENDSQDMAVIISRLKELREAGFTILLLHHTPKSNEGIYKGSTALLDLVDHCLSIEEIKDEETFEFGKENIYRLGARIKTRYEPHHIFLKFNPDVKGFELAKDPDTELMEIMYDILAEAGKPLNQSEFVKAVREKAEVPKSKTERLIKKGIGIFWCESKGVEKRSLLYYPRAISQFPKHIYSQEIRKYPLQEDTSLGNSDDVNSHQSLDNTEFPNFPEGGLGNQEIGQGLKNTPENTHTDLPWQCQGCMLTPGMRRLCEVRKPCPRGGEAYDDEK